MDDSSIQRWTRMGLLLLGVCLWGMSAGRADPAALLLQERRDGIRVTVWMDPAVPRVGRILLNAVVEDTSTGSVLREVGLISRLRPPAGSGELPMDPVCGRDTAVGMSSGWVPWKPPAFGNQVLRGTEAWLSVPGVWSLEVRVQSGGREDEFRVAIPVEPSASGIRILLWGVGLPSLMVALYAGTRGWGVTR